MNNEQDLNVITEDERNDSENTNSKKIYLQVDNGDNASAEIDIINVVSNMAKRKKIYKYVFAIAICAGLLAGGIKILIGQITKNDCYAQAVITLQFDGVEDGLDPNGASFDINKLKSPTVIEDALSTLGETEFSSEDIRSNITIEGVIPEDAVERITVIKEMALDNASNYEKILDVSYFPSQYVVYLYQQKGMSAAKTREILNAVLDSYRQYFFDTYANTEVLAVTSNLFDYENYDYTESVDMIESQIGIIQNYVAERKEQSPDFRASSTGLSFGDIATSLDSIEQVDLANLSSYIENVSLSKDRERLVQYYNYKIKQFNMQLSEAQSNFNTVQDTIDNYEKNPIVIVSSQESTQQITQTSAYYDELVQQKLDISMEMASIKTKLDEATERLEVLGNLETSNTQDQYDYADKSLESIAGTITDWIELIEETTDEYYSTTLFSNAVKVAVPAQYEASGGLTSILKTMGISVVVMMFIVFVIWCIDGLRIEICLMRSKNKKG
jgi:hypothetical protein